MPGHFTDNAAKRVVREQWDTPILRYLNRTYGTRYRYMGLPGVDLIDVTLWKDMIDEVIAFEPPDNSFTRRESIIQLRRNMKRLGLPGIAYYGSMEEVICLRRDWDGQEYSQNKIITLYNFDFCDEISSRIDTLEKGRKVWRFEAIRQAFRDQAECYRITGGPSYFILMLTVRNQINADKIRSYLNTLLLTEATQFYKVCHQVLPIPTNRLPLIGTHQWAIKTFLFDFLCKNFVNPHLSALLFPMVLYDGTRTGSGIPSPMIHWIMLCRFAEIERQSPQIFPNTFLRHPSVAIGRRNNLKWFPQTGEGTAPIARPPDCVQWLTDFGGDILRMLG